MGRLIATRLARVVAVLLVVSFGTLLMVNLLPGGPAIGMLGENATPEMVADVNRQYGFDDPLPVRYVRWLADLASGDFGASYRTNQTVITAVKERLPLTLELAIGAQVIALTLAVTLALTAAARAGRPFDRVTTTIMSGIVAVPTFVSSFLLAYLFAVRLRWVPVFGWVRLTESVGENLKSAILPMLALALPEVAAYQRLLRNDVLATLQEEFITAARAKGLSNRRVMLRHALRPSSFSIVTLAAVNFGRLIAGAVIVETIFGLPGLGQLMFQSVGTRDVLMMQGLVMFVAVVYMLLNSAVDIFYGVLDPRVRTTGGR